MVWVVEVVSFFGVDWGGRGCLVVRVVGVVGLLKCLGFSMVSLLGW